MEDFMTVPLFFRLFIFTGQHICMLSLHTHADICTDLYADFVSLFTDKYSHLHPISVCYTSYRLLRNLHSPQHVEDNNAR